LRAGSQFREKAQRYHNRILSNVSPARFHVDSTMPNAMTACASVDGRHDANMLKGAVSPRVAGSALSPGTPSDLREESLSVWQ
jgi:hypothetical protein